MINETIRVYFKYKDESVADPDWNYPRKHIPNVGDEIFLANVREDPYERYWYTVEKRRWLGNQVVEIRLNNSRWKIED